MIKKTKNWTVKYINLIIIIFTSSSLAGYFFERQFAAYIGFILPAMFAMIIIVNRVINNINIIKSSTLFFIVLIINLIMGIYGGYNPKDMIADALFFAMPLLGYVAARNITSGRSIVEIKKNMFVALSVVFCIGVVEKTISIAHTGNFIYYGGPYLFWPFFYYLYLIGDKVKKPQIKFTIYFFYFFAPVLIASKTLLLSAWGYYIFARKNIVIIFIILLITLFIVMAFIGTRINLESMPFVIQRLLYLTSSLTGGELGDGSTNARIVEVTSVLYTMSENGIFRSIIGHGLGAVYYPLDGLLIEGVSDENKREDGYHHLHMGWLVVLFRHGLLGVILYLLPLIIMARKPLIDGEYHWRAFALIVFIGMFMGWSFVYGSLIFGLFFALYSEEKKSLSG